MLWEEPLSEFLRLFWELNEAQVMRVEKAYEKKKKERKQNNLRGVREISTKRLEIRSSNPHFWSKLPRVLNEKENTRNSGGIFGKIIRISSKLIQSLHSFESQFVVEWFPSSSWPQINQFWVIPLWMSFQPFKLFFIYLNAFSVKMAPVGSLMTSEVWIVFEIIQHRPIWSPESHAPWAKHQHHQKRSVHRQVPSGSQRKKAFRRRACQPRPRTPFVRSPSLRSPFSRVLQAHSQQRNQVGLFYRHWILGHYISNGGFHWKQKEPWRKNEENFVQQIFWREAQWSFRV